jgi:hypothetical protein
MAPVTAPLLIGAGTLVSSFDAYQSGQSQAQALSYESQVAK